MIDRWIVFVLVAGLVVVYVVTDFIHAVRYGHLATKHRPRRGGRR